MTCARGAYVWGEDATREGGGGEWGKVDSRLMHNSRAESIDTSSLSIAHEYETNATPVTYGVHPRPWRFFLSICLVSLNSEKKWREKK